MPTGQLLVEQARMPKQPIACMAELEMAIPASHQLLTSGDIFGIQFRLAKLAFGNHRFKITVRNELSQPRIAANVPLGR